MPHRIGFNKQRRPHFFKQWRTKRGLSQERLAERLETSAATVEQVRFESARPRLGVLTARRAAEANLPPSRPLVVGGYLVKPDGAGPFPAVAMLHGCAGLSTSFRKDPASSPWVARLVRWG